VIHLIGSYCGDVSFNYTACRDLMPDPDFYTQCMIDSFDELMAETGQTRRATLLNPAPKSAAPTSKPKTKKVAVKKKAVAKSPPPKKRVVKRQTTK